MNASLLRLTLHQWVVVFLVCCTALPAHAQSSATDEVRALLETQRQAWNRGDLDGFMAGYEADSQTRFASGANIREGWQQAFDAYKKSYPDTQAMGRLEFDLIEVRSLGPDAVYVFGRWRVTTAQRAQPAHGVFTLIVERKEGVWRVTRDHTSSAP